jgi:hypothetical protein
MDQRQQVAHRVGERVTIAIGPVWLEPTAKVVAALIAQIRANGEILHVSRSVFANSKLEKVTDDIVLDGAVAEFDKCKAWLAG